MHASENDALEWDVADRLRKSLRASGVGVQVMADYLGMSRNSTSADVIPLFPATPRRAA